MINFEQNKFILMIFLQKITDFYAEKIKMKNSDHRIIKLDDAII